MSTSSRNYAAPPEMMPITISTIDPERVIINLKKQIRLLYYVCLLMAIVLLSFIIKGPRSVCDSDNEVGEINKTNSTR